MGGYQDLLARGSTRRFPVRYAAWIKYLIWGGWLAGLLLLFHRTGGVQGISFALETEKGFSTTSLPAMIAYTCVIAAFLGISLLTGPRGSCHTICWMAPFMVIGRRVGLAAGIPSLRLSTDPDNCISCGKCTRSCPMSLEVEKLAASGSITDNSCILCGKCVSACPSRVIRFSWKKGWLSMDIFRFLAFFILLQLQQILSAYPSALIYDETTGDVTESVSYTISQASDGNRTIILESTDEIHRILVDSRWNTLRWESTLAISDGFTLLKTSSDLDRGKGKAPWYQSLLCLGERVLSGEKKIPFLIGSAHFDEKLAGGADIQVMNFVALYEKQEIVHTGYGEVNAYLYNVTFNDLRSLFWKSRAWFDAEGLLVAYEAAGAVPVRRLPEGFCGRKRVDKRIAEFILLSYLLSWLAFLPGMLAVKGLVSSNAASVFHYCAPLGPALAALYAAFREGGYPGLKKFLSRAFALPGINVPIIFLLMLVPAGAGFGMLFMHLIGTDLPEGFYSLEFSFLHNPAVVWLFWIITYGLGEETGWRGYLLPRLLEEFSPQKAWMIVTAVWMC